MKKSILILSTLFVFDTIAMGQTIKENQFAQIVTNAFKSKNYEQYKKCLMSKTDFKEFISDLNKHAFYKGSNDELIKAIEVFEKQADSTHRADFAFLLKKGEEIGIDWGQIQPGKFVFKTDKPGNSSKEVITGHINFQSKDTTYVIFGLEAVKLSTGYKINTIRAILKGGVEQYVEPDLLDEEGD